MDLDSIRNYCLSLPGAAERVQWGDDLLFCVGGKMFAVACLEPAAGVQLSFKCTPESFAELLEREGVSAAPYVGRYQWVALERFDTLPTQELRELIRQSYELVTAKLPKSKRPVAGELIRAPGKPARRAR